MFWNKKEEKKSLPDLPESDFNSQASIPKFPEEKEEHLEKNALPSFPDSPIKKGFSQAAIKDAVSAKDEEDEDGEKFDDEVDQIQNQKQFKTIEMHEWSPRQEQSSQLINRIAEQKQIPLPPPVFSTQKQQEIYVKIDKFHLAKKSLEGIGQKLDEIDELLKKIRETKLREEQELTSWEKEISAAKSRIQDVRENIFERKI